MTEHLVCTSLNNCETSTADSILLVVESEDELEGKLRRARATHLVQWAQDAKRTRKRGGRLPEGGAILLHIAEIRMIEDVENFGPKLQLQPFKDRKVSADS